jgi:hypothetical protein
MINSQRFSLQKSAWFLALPLLWGGVSLAAKIQPAPPQEYQFIPVAIHASDSADYGVDSFASASLAPVNPEIIIDARNDNGISNPGAVDTDKGHTPEDRDNKTDTQSQDQQAPAIALPTIDLPTTVPISTPDPGTNGNGNGNNGNGNGNGGSVDDTVDGVVDGVDDALPGNGNGNANGQGNGNSGNGNGNGNNVVDDAVATATAVVDGIIHHGH